MNPHYTYLLVDLSAIFVPLIAGFHPKLKFYKNPFAVFVPILLAAIPFILADHLFTHMGVWGFNPNYLTGIYIFNLPLEEYLFFICIPFSCLFTYHCFRVFNISWLSKNAGKKMAQFLILFLIIVGTYFYDRWYTVTTFFALAIAMFFVLVKMQNFNFGRFFSVYSILLIPFFICNGILTGTGPDQPVVWYNDLENMGIRMFTIPFEDTFYGMLLIFLSCLFNEKWIYKKVILIP